MAPQKRMSGMRTCHIPLRSNSKCAGKNADVQVMQSDLVGMNRAAVQHKHGTIVGAARRTLWAELPAWPSSLAEPLPMIQPKPSEFFIQGVTLEGQTFRPSDWAERLAGAMSCFRPDGVQGGIASFIGYSPLCVPRVINGIKCVIVSEALRGSSPWPGTS
jgi:hypothetical protein